MPFQSRCLPESRGESLVSPQGRIQCQSPPEGKGIDLRSSKSFEKLRNVEVLAVYYV